MGMTRTDNYGENQESRIGRKSETEKHNHVKELRIYSVQLIGRGRPSLGLHWVDHKERREEKQQANKTTNEQTNKQTTIMQKDIKFFFKQRHRVFM